MGFFHRFENALPGRHVPVTVAAFPNTDFPNRVQIPGFRGKDIVERPSKALQDLETQENILELSNVSRPRKAAKALHFFGGKWARRKVAPKFRSYLPQFVEPFPERQ